MAIRSIYVLIIQSILMMGPDLAAQDIAFTAIGKEDLKSIIEEFSANFTHTTVSPATPLGWFLGAETGGVAGVTKTPRMNRLVKEASDGTGSLSMIPHGAGLFRLTIPWGFTFEYSQMPSIHKKNFQLRYRSFGALWTVTHAWKMAPVHIGFRGHMSEGKFAFHQVINNASTSNQDVDAKVAINTKVFGGSLQVNAHLLFFEPYAGIGYAKTNGQMNIFADNSVTIFDTDITVTGEQNARIKTGTVHFYGGVHLDFWFFHLGAEYSKLFDTERFSAKVSFAI